MKKILEVFILLACIAHMNVSSAQENKASSYQGRNIFSCAGIFAGESVVETYSVMLLELWSQKLTDGFSKAFSDANQKLAKFEGDCIFYEKSINLIHKIMPAGKRILITKKGNEEYVLYRTQGSAGVAYQAYIEKTK